MRPFVSTALLLAAVATSVTWSEAQAQASLEGAWIATAWESGGEAIAGPRRGLLVFTKNHYSIMFVSGANGRPRYTGNTITDAEKLAAYDSFTANAGIYSVSGNTIVTKAYMAKDPNYMGQWTEACPTGKCPNEATLAFRIEGTDLHVTWPARLAGGSGTTGTFRRVE